MKSLRVIQSAPVWLPRTQTWMHSQASHLPDSIESHVVCDRTENLETFPVPHLHSLEEGGALYRFWDKGLRTLGVRRHPGLLDRIGQRIGAGVIHSHFGHIGWRDLRALPRAAHVVTFYGQDLGLYPRRDPRWRDRYRDMFAAVDRVLCEGHHMAEGLRGLGCPDAKITVQHLGLDLDRFAFRPRRWSGDEPLRALLAGSFTEKKGLGYAIEALGALGRPVEVTVVGDANREPRNQAEKARILEAIEKSGLTVRLLGYQSHDRLLEEADAHDVFVSPSVTAADGDTEGGAPVTLIEMAALGMPVVSTRHADIPEVLPERLGSLLADERNVDGLVAHLEWLAAAPERWEGLTRAIRSHIESEYDVHVQARRLAAVYVEVAG
jgi:colanic acid/amylovoran biosynthesis glycosyltransferase